MMIKMARNQKVVCGKTLKLGPWALSIVHISNENISSFSNKMKEKSAFNLSFFPFMKMWASRHTKGTEIELGTFYTKRLTF